MSFKITMDLFNEFRNDLEPFSMSFKITMDLFNEFRNDLEPFQ